MTPARYPALLLLAAVALLPLHAQTPSPATQAAPAPPPTGPLNRTLIVLDASHGGVDSGSRIGDSILEKDVTLSLATHLRDLLQAHGFTVIMTRDNDAATLPNSGTPLSLADRAGIANHARAVACLLLHATGAGAGVHLYTSELAPAAAEAPLLPWLTAQAAWVTQSDRLKKQVATSLAGARIPTVTATASIRPVDSLTCPALVVELAPNTDDPNSINSADYQQRVSNAVAASMVFWRNLAQPPIKILPPPPPPKLPAPSVDTP
ncbi:MAG: N-acetylmuramoyl-L-alanine amidase [Acidobacteriota bacterium]